MNAPLVRQPIQFSMKRQISSGAVLIKKSLVSRPKCISLLLPTAACRTSWWQVIQIRKPMKSSQRKMGSWPSATVKNSFFFLLATTCKILFLSRNSSATTAAAQKGSRWSLEHRNWTLRSTVLMSHRVRRSYLARMQNCVGVWPSVDDLFERGGREEEILFWVLWKTGWSHLLLIDWPASILQRITQKSNLLFSKGVFQCSCCCERNWEKSADAQPVRGCRAFIFGAILIIT